MNNSETEVKAIQGLSRKLPFYVTLAAAVIVVAAFFLPLATANTEYAEYLKNRMQALNEMDAEITTEDTINVSMFDFAKMYWTVYSAIDKTMATVVAAVIGITGILSLLTLLFAIFRKPIAVMVFNALTFGAYYLMTWDFKDRKVLPNRHYDWGLAYYLYYIGIAAVFAGAIWLLIVKIKNRKQKKVDAITENLQ